MNCPFCNDDRILQARSSGFLESHIQNMRFFRPFRCQCCGESFFAWTLRISSHKCPPMRTDERTLAVPELDTGQRYSQSSNLGPRFR